MRETVLIQNKRGLHARAAAKFVKLVEAHDATVTVFKDGSEVCGQSIMGLLMLGAGQGCSIDVQTEGAQKEQVMDALLSLVARKFDEE